MKLKRLLSLAVLCIVGMTSAWAEDIQELKALGWTQVTSIENVDQNYYVLVDAQTGLYSVGRGLVQGDRPMYHNLGNPTSDKNQVWILEGSGTSYKMKNLNDSYYFNSGDAGWNDYMDASNGTNFTFTLNNGKYDITATTGSVGPWNNDNKVSLGDAAENVAVNKAANQAPGFYLFAMSRTQYDALRFTATNLEAQGWQKATNIANIAGDSYYVIFLEAKGGSLAMAKTKSGRPAYKSLTNPLSNKAILWQLEASGTNYALKSVASGNYFQTEDWNTGFGDTKNYRTFVSLGEGKYALKNSSNDMYVGRWQNQEAAPYELENIAANKNETHRGNYFVYYMSVSDYNTKRAAAITAATEGASEETPKDLTGYIYNPRFSDLDRNGWTEGGTSGNRQFGSNAAECWQNNNMTFSQTFANMPAGKYTLSLQAVNPSNGSTTGAKAFIGSEEKDITATHSSGNYAEVCAALMNDASLGVISLDAVLQEDGDLTFGMKATTGWVIFDNFSLTYKGEVASAELGEVELSRTDGQYINSSKFIVKYPNALSPNVGDELAVVSNAKVTVNGTEVTPVKEGYGFYFEIPNYAANSGYSVTIPANIFGFNSVKNEAISLNLHTPAILDGTYYFYNPYVKKYMSRGGVWATSGIFDDWGLAINLRTDAEGMTTFQYFDNQRYIFSGANDGFTYGDGTNAGRFKASAVDGGYEFQNMDGPQENPGFLAHWGGRIVDDGRKGDNLDGTSNVWTIETVEEHKANYARNANTQAKTAAEAAGFTARNAADLETEIAGYTNVEMPIKGAKAERWQWYATAQQQLKESEYYKEVVTNLPAGFYKLTVDAFQRAGENDWVAAAGGARGLIYLYANGAKTQLKSVMEYGADNAYATDWQDFEYSGKHYPNSESTGYTALSTDNYKNVVYVYVPADEGKTTGTLNIGINNPVRQGNNLNTNTWAVFDNWKLEFICKDATDYVADGVHHYIGAYENMAVETTDETPTVDLTLANISGTVTATATNTNGLVYTKAGQNISGISNNVVVGTTCANLVLTGDGNFKAHKAFTATSATYTANVASGNDPEGQAVSFGTLVLPYAVSALTNSGKAYKLTASPMGDYSVATKVTKLEANKPYIITAAGAYAASDVTIAPTTGVTLTNGDLTGTYTQIDAPANAYVLQKHSNVVAFYMNGGANPKVNPFHAYIPANEQGVKALRVVFDDDETGVDSMRVNASTTQQAIYDLSGRRVQKAQKGIYIINGKKVMK